MKALKTDGLHHIEDDLPKMFMILIVSIAVIFSVIMIANIYSTEQSREECSDRCLELGKEYYEYKPYSGGLFSTTHKECWCRENNDTVRIY